MSDKLRPLPLNQLLAWLLEEEKSGQVFGISKALFWVPGESDPFRLQRYGRLLETPVGVAAGPHTQMSQNIVVAWLLGARYIELKTVQTLDQLDVPKPCIDAEDEGYNCEWSQELRLDQSFDEYLNAWILIHILKHRYGWGQADEPGVIFNMSVGYDMAGILQPNVQRFLDRMQDCRQEKEEKIEQLAKIYPGVKEISIPDCISDNITLSTMHGCPPQEIEQIGRYLIEQRGLHTSIKLNPTLLGAETLRTLLNEKLGYQTVVPDEAFEHDLKFTQAVHIIRSLRESADKHGVAFGLKLSNTLESLNHRHVFPPTEKMMYMSGRALHPLTVHLARMLQEAFDGELDISFAGGADAFNVAELVACGLTPVTVCTDLLKPGGYARLPQYLQELERAMKSVSANSIEEFILLKNKKAEKNLSAAALSNLRDYSERVVDNPVYKKDFYPNKSIKTDRRLTLFDCIYAPCVDTCAVHQDVPKYMYFVARGEYDRALKIVLQDNPFPAVTGMACDHLCQTKCTRLNYDNPLLIREIKRFIEENARAPKLTPAPANGVRVAIIGAGPSGLACAYFLALAGCRVRVYEEKSRPGGMVASALPGFRISDEALARDIRRIERLGVELFYKVKIDRAHFHALREQNDFVYLAIGAQAGRRLDIAGEDSRKVIDALQFLADVRNGRRIELGNRVAVVGGGNTAMDAARTALRLIPKQGRVTILYRRTKKEMPADAEELTEAIREGVEIVELTSPVEIRQQNGRLRVRCTQMELGEPDESGRRRPVPVPGSEFWLEFDSLITAVGQDVVLDFLDPQDLQADPVTHETRLSGVYIGGDALRGPSSIILSIADGKFAAENMLKAAGKSLLFPEMLVDKALTFDEYQQKSARRQFGITPMELPDEQRRSFKLVMQTLSGEQARAEAERCLFCDDICNVCVTVCPNRANLSYRINPMEYRLQKIVRTGDSYTIKKDRTFSIDQSYQVLNLADWCNECGNCTTFCPTSGAPYLDKPRLCLSEQSFNEESVAYRLGKEGGHVFIHFKENGRLHALKDVGDTLLYDTRDAHIRLHAETFAIIDFRMKSQKNVIELWKAAEMNVLLQAFRDSHLLKIV